MQDKIINSELSESDCDSKDVLNFLKLLKISDQLEKPPNFRLITLEEQKFVVAKAKKRSTLSIFLYRNYAMYECMVRSERMNLILIQYYNLIIRQCYFPSRWLKILDIMIEKGKGPVIGKLRTI